MKRLSLAVLALLALGLALATNLGLNEQASAQGAPRIVAVDGIATIQGEPVRVHILVLVPPNAQASDAARAALAAQGARPITSADFSLTGSVDWTDDPGDGIAADVTVTVNYRDQDDPTGSGAQVLLQSFAPWSNVSGSSLAIVKGDFTITRSPSLVRESPGRQRFDGRNDLAWMDLKDRNTLGVTWSGTSGGNPEADIAINTDFPWFTDGVQNYDAQTVITHELGHLLGIGHSSVGGAVMEPVYAGVRRGLDPDDADAVRALYGEPNTPPAVTITSPEDGDVVASGATITFTGSATDAEDTDDPVVSWSSSLEASTLDAGNATLSDGIHTITASATDSGGMTGSASITITVGDPPPGPTTVSVASVTYSMSGGPQSNRNLSIRIDLLDNHTDPVADASVSIALFHDDVLIGTGTGTTGTSGVISFRLRNAPSGDYETVVTNVSADGLTWNGLTPANSFTK